MPDIYFTDAGGQRRAVSEDNPLPTGVAGGGGGMEMMSVLSGGPGSSFTLPATQPVDLGPLLPTGARVRDVAERFNELLLALEAAGYGTVSREE